MWIETGILYTRSLEETIDYHNQWPGFRMGLELNRGHSYAILFIAETSI